jgi:LmbE family N-acetylglucosaminyl deacetylase
MRAAGLEPPFGDEEPTFGVPDELITTTIDVSPWVETKRAALMAHKTQMGADVFFTQLPPQLFNELFCVERFIRVESRVPAPDQEDDLLAGL